MKKLIESFIVILVAITFIITITYPAIFHISTDLIGDGGDNYEYASYQALAAHNIGNGLYPFVQTTFWRYPVGFDFSRGFDSYLVVLFGAITTLLFGMPAGYNLSIFFIFFLNALCSYVLFKKLSRSIWLGVIGMIIYGFSFYSIARSASHPNLMFTGGFSLYATALYELFVIKKIHIYSLLLLMCSILLIALGSMEYILFTFLFSSLFILLTFIFYRSELDHIKKYVYKKPLSIVLLLAGMFLLLLGLYFPHLIAVISHTYIVPDRHSLADVVIPSLSDFLLPNQYFHLFFFSFIRNTSLNSIERTVFVGFIELLLFLIALVGNKDKKRSLFLLVLFLCPFVLALGYNTTNSFPLLPYHVLHSLFPFNIIVETGRYMVVGYLILTITIILFLKHVRFKKLKHVIFSLLILGLLSERLPSKIYLSSSYNNSFYTNLVKSLPGNAVLDLPLNIYYPRYNFLSFRYQKPIVNGYFHWSADGIKEQSFLTQTALNRLFCSQQDISELLNANDSEETRIDNEIIRELETNGITTIVVHKDDKYFFTECRNVRIRLNHLIPYEIPLSPTTTSIPFTHILESGRPSYTFFFPSEGVFYVDGIYLATRSPAHFSLLDNYSPPSFPYAWNITSEQTVTTLSGKEPIHLSVKGGSHFTIYSSDLIDYTYLSMWYRYIPHSGVKEFTFRPHIQMMYDDSTVTVYQINTEK